MREWLAIGLMTFGVLFVGGGVIGANVALFRYMPRRPVLPRGRSHPNAAQAFRFVYLISLAAALTAAGLASLLLGGVVGFGIPAQAVALPLCLLIGALVVAGYARLRVRNPRDSN